VFHRGAAGQLPRNSGLARLPRSSVRQRDKCSMRRSVAHGMEVLSMTPLPPHALKGVAIQGVSG
jgi:hypothetical protein